MDPFINIRVHVRYFNPSEKIPPAEKNLRTGSSAPASGFSEGEIILRKERGGKRQIRSRTGNSVRVSPLGAAVLAIQGVRTLRRIDDDYLSFPLRGAEVRRRYCIHNRDNVPDTAATGAASPGSIRNRIGNFLHEHDRQYFPGSHKFCEIFLRGIHHPAPQ